MLANECRNVALTDVVLLVTLASLLAAALPSGAAHDFIRLYYTYSNLHRTRCDSVVGRGRRLGWFVGSGRALARCGQGAQGCKPGRFAGRAAQSASSSSLTCRPPNASAWPSGPTWRPRSRSGSRDQGTRGGLLGYDEQSRNIASGNRACFLCEHFGNLGTRLPFGLSDFVHPCPPDSDRPVRWRVVSHARNVGNGLETSRTQRQPPPGK